MPKFASSIFIEGLAGVNSIESEIEYRKLFLVDCFLYQTYQLLLIKCFKLELRAVMMRKYHLLVSFLLFLRHCVSTIS